MSVQIQFICINNRGRKHKPAEQKSEKRHERKKAKITSKNKSKMRKVLSKKKMKTTKRHTPKP